MSRILVVEDEQHLADGLRFNLEAEGHEAEVVDNGERALAPDLGDAGRSTPSSSTSCCPGIDGFEVAAELRAARPVRAGADADRARPRRRTCCRVRGRRRRLPAEAVRAGHPARARRAACCGAPRGAQQEPARQRPPRGARHVRVRATARIDFAALELHARRSNRLPLTLMEATLLRYLVQHAGQPVSRKAILEDVWGRARGHRHARHRQLHRAAAALHRRRPHAARHLLTVRGIGYRFVAGGA